MPARRPITSEAALGVRDTGIFSDLDPRVQLTLAPELDRGTLHALVDRPRAQLALYSAQLPIKVYPLAGAIPLRVGAVELLLRPGDAAELAPLLRAEALQVVETRVELPPGDLDDDGIPDPLDLLIGAHKTALNAASYDGRFERIAFPGGDVPRTIGVCTDVVIRALRNAGIDLQRELQRDLARTPSAYPMIAQPNPHIDHRRVKSLLPWFERRFERHSTRVDDPADPLQPGDIVFLDTFPSRPGSEHVGIVSDQRSPGGLPLVINNWTDGTVTRPMELLSWVPVTERFRIPARVQASAELATTATPTAEASAPIAAATPQLITVVNAGWASRRAQLRRYARAAAGTWTEQGSPLEVVLGHAGYGWGRGLHGAGAPAGRAGPGKREGDGRSPAGVFALGSLYGSAPTAPSSLWPYVSADPSLRCVDDPRSADYTKIVPAAAGSGAAPGEAMLREDGLYALALVVEHNTAQPLAGAGSCIFLHVWQGPGIPTTGCTALPLSALTELARWLQPGALLVALPRAEYAHFERAWALPPL